MAWFSLVKCGTAKSFVYLSGIFGVWRCGECQQSSAKFEWKKIWWQPSYSCLLSRKQVLWRGLWWLVVSYPLWVVRSAQQVLCSFMVYRNHRVGLVLDVKLVSAFLFGALFVLFWIISTYLGLIFVLLVVDIFFDSLKYEDFGVLVNSVTIDANTDPSLHTILFLLLKILNVLAFHLFIFIFFSFKNFRVKKTTLQWKSLYQTLKKTRDIVPSSREEKTTKISSQDESCSYFKKIILGG